jgi:anti-sigma factor ChrR (cupin superfamily)
VRFNLPLDQIHMHHIRMELGEWSGQIRGVRWKKIEISEDDEVDVGRIKSTLDRHLTKAIGYLANCY